MPGDPDAGHPDAVPVPDEASLGAVLRDQVIGHATRFLAVYGPQVRFGRHTQWAEVTDRLDKALLLAGRSCGSAQAGAADARLVLADGEKPLTSASRIRQVTDDRGRVHWTRRRGSLSLRAARGGASDAGPLAAALHERERSEHRLRQFIADASTSCARR